ncbi:hypothetical protein [Streptomyces sp. NPDC001774]
MTALIRLLRGVAYTALPAELVLAVCLVAGVRIPMPVLAAAEALTVLFALAGLVAYAGLRRRGLSTRQALRELVPVPVLRLIGHELRLLASLGLWVARHRAGVRPGDQVFPHARDQAALMYGFAFVCLVETVGMSYLLADRPVAHAIVLVLDVYSGILFVLGIHAASVTRPHILTADTLRLRQAAHIDLHIPLGLIAAVRHELRFTHEKTEGELNLAVASQTSVTIELTEPVDAPRFLGGPRAVRIVRCHADDARAFYRALTRAVPAGAATAQDDATQAGTAHVGTTQAVPAQDDVTAQGTAPGTVPVTAPGTVPVTAQTLTPGRTAPSPTAGPPA